MATTLPILLPDKAIPRSPSTVNLEWKPTKYLSAPQPPPTDEGKIQDIDARQMLDGKLIKKTRPRRTVDYNGAMGRWALVRLVIVDLQLAKLSVCHGRCENYGPVRRMYLV
jgi:polyadenylation factor subunit 2